MRPPCAKRPIDPKPYPTMGLPFLLTLVIATTMLVVSPPDGTDGSP
jgi:hypothetical protein